MKRKRVKGKSCLGAFLFLSCALSTMGYAGTWKNTGMNWQYLAESGDAQKGWLLDSGTWYFLDENTGVMKDKWLFYQGKWYFLNPQSDGSRGKMLSGWQWVDGYCYFLKGNGELLLSAITPDGYQVNELGQWVSEDGKAIHVEGKGYSTKVVEEENKNPVVAGASRAVPGGSGSQGRRGGSGSGGGGLGGASAVSPAVPKEEKKEMGNAQEESNKKENPAEPPKEEKKPEEKKENSKENEGGKESEVSKLTVTSVKELAAVSIEQGRSYYDNELPTKLELNLSNGKKVEASILSIDKQNVKTWQPGEYLLKVNYNLPEGVEGEKPEVLLRFIVRKKSSFTLEKEEYDVSEDVVLQFHEDQLEEGDTIHLEAGKSEEDYYYKELTEGREYETDYESNSVILHSDALLKKLYSSVYKDGKLSGSKKVYLDISRKKKGQSGLSSYSLHFTYRNAEKKDEKEDPKKENLIEAHPGGGVTSFTQRREDLRFPFYHGNYESLDFGKIGQVRFYVDGSKEELTGLKLFKGYANEDVPEDGYEAILVLPFSTVQEKLQDNQIRIYGEGGGYKIAPFTISYEKE